MKATISKLRWFAATILVCVVATSHVLAQPAGPETSACANCKTQVQEEAARYLDRLRSAVESQGREHCSEPKGKRRYGSVKVQLTVNSQGTLKNLKFPGRSSAPLRKCSEELLKSAAPFEPFSQMLAEEVDQVVLSITFNFTNDP